MAVAVASKLETIPISLVPLALIDESPTNPRKTFKDLEDLAENVKVRGVLQPVMVRPRGTRFELVFGARRLRAAKIAQLDTIPATVRDLPDHEVIEIQLIENSKREDISPLEEADGYRELIDHHGYAPDELAAKVNKSRRTIYERLQLCKLGKDGREAMAKGRLHLSVAILVARIPAELQAQAVKDMAARDDQDPPLPYRSAVDHVQKNYMRQLKDAPFDVTDAQLLPKAGACAACPKRTGNQRELFADVKGADVCTDPKCYQAKEDAVWKLKVRAAESSGQKVLSPAEAKKVFQYGAEEPVYNAPFKSLDQREWTGTDHKTVKAILGKDVPATVLARTPDGKIVELVPRSAVEKKLEALHPKGRSVGSFGDDHQAKFRKQQVFKGKVCAAALARLVDKAELDQGGRKLLAFVAASLFRGGYHDGNNRAAKRRGIEKDALVRDIPKMTDAGLAGLIVEVIAGDNATAGWAGSGYGTSLTEACKLFGVDLKKLAAEAKVAKKLAKKKSAA